ncbi:MAG TPA: M1 family metallopeptidase, partial [Longimicrobiales bacterium]
IRGRTRARIALVAPRQDTLPLDLTGLVVDGVAVNDQPAGFRYEQGKLRVALPGSAHPGDTVSVEVRYHGHPRDGLIIGPDVHGQRAAFADDWPNRARFWFPSIDHPSDKATADIQVLAPRGWEVVANGASTAPAALPREWAADTAGRVVAHWVTQVPIPTYTMVLGATHFAVTPAPGAPPPAGPTSGGPVRITAWLYPEDSARAARSFRRANDIVAWYGELVAPFPYEKLAHVESATRFGGMENASAIFYDEKALAAGMDIEETVAHETAHQWFGDSVTEADWHHLWLSEGFATYFSALFFQHADGEERFRAIMRRGRAAYLASEDTARPIIDPAEQDLFALLNRNNYEKGAWVLHMARGLLGDSAFFDGLRSYYRAHAGGNALTSDLQQALESASGRELGWFFQQWLYQPGYPRIRVAWRWLAAEHAAEVTISQVQSASWPTFRFPLDLMLATPGGALRRQVLVTRREETFRVASPAAPTAVSADPEDRLLLVVETAPR